MEETNVFEIALSVIECRGCELLDEHDSGPNWCWFQFPNPSSVAMVQHWPCESLVEVTVPLYVGQLNPLLHHGVLQLFNQLHSRYPGYLLTYDSEEDREEVIQLTTFVPFVDQHDPGELGMLLDQRLERLEKIYQSYLPPVTEYVRQKPCVRIGSDGKPESVRLPVTVADVLHMVETGPFGRA